jgi:hypothetical protein
MDLFIEQMGYDPGTEDSEKFPHAAEVRAATKDVDWLDWLELYSIELGRHSGSRPGSIHTRPELPPDDRECVVQVEATGEWLLASFTTQPGRWVCPYAQPVPHLAADDVIMWVALRDLFAAER